MRGLLDKSRKCAGRKTNENFCAGNAFPAQTKLYSLGLLDYILYVSIRALLPQTLTDEHTKKIYHVYIFYLDYHVYIFSKRGLNDIEQLPYSKR